VNLLGRGKATSVLSCALCERQLFAAHVSVSGQLRMYEHGPLFIRPEASIKSVCADSVLVYTLGRLNKTKYKTHTATNAKTAQIYTRNRRTGLPELQVDGDKRTFPLLKLCCFHVTKISDAALVAHASSTTL
jgi:hypothetical protein